MGVYSRSVLNQDQTGLRSSELGPAIQRSAYMLHFGRLTFLPYPSGPGESGDQGHFALFAPYVEVPLFYQRGYWGEAFTSMQPFYEPPHPTGLPDDAPATIGPFGEEAR